MILLLKSMKYFPQICDFRLFLFKIIVFILHKDFVLERCL